MDDGELLKAIGSGSSVLSAGGAGVELEVHLKPCLLLRRLRRL
jgi:hypothetical protein